MDYLSFAILCEELERADTSFRVVQSVHVGLNSGWRSCNGDGGATATLAHPRPARQARHLQLADEARCRNRCRQPQTTARRDGDAYQLNGQKIWISLADIADHFLVFARPVDRAKEAQGRDRVHARSGA
jgi:alkylation response protein AidB-like acyl-CoA dehydrogenase